MIFLTNYRHLIVKNFIKLISVTYQTNKKMMFLTILSEVCKNKLLFEWQNVSIG